MMVPDERSYSSLLPCGLMQEFRRDSFQHAISIQIRASGLPTQRASFESMVGTLQSSCMVGVCRQLIFHPAPRVLQS